jgi:uncharacterized membrane protein YbhN (UPF0104 family)
MEMATQIIFTVLGFTLLLARSPELRLFGWGVAAVSLALVILAAFILAQRGGGLKLVEAGLSRLASRLPALSSLARGGLHDRLMRLHRRRRAAVASGCLHLGSWLLGAGEVWLILLALGHPTGLARCAIIEALSMTARSAGFLVPGGLGVQEGALVVVGNLVGLTPETAILLAIVKRLREVVVAVPGLLVWQWTEGRRLRAVPAPSDRPLERPQSPGLAE